MAPPRATVTARRYVPRRGQVLRRVVATLFSWMPRRWYLFRRRVLVEPEPDGAARPN
jgi:hypothetical protein